MRKRIPVGIVLLLMTSGCYIYRGYQVKSLVNDATFLRSRYTEHCVTTRLPDTPCEEWNKEQVKLDTTAKEALQALETGGKEKLQMNTFKKELKAMKKEFSKWVF